MKKKTALNLHGLYIEGLSQPNYHFRKNYFSQLSLAHFNALRNWLFFEMETLCHVGAKMKRFLPPYGIGLRVSEDIWGKLVQIGKKTILSLY